MKNSTRKRRIKINWIIKRTSDDACILCGLHGNYGGGHSFRGRKFIEETDCEEVLIDEHGWIYLDGIQICPECFERIYTNWKKMTEKTD